MPFLLLFAVGLTAQDLIYTPPLKGPLLITGTFGELRSDHFHAGLDFRASTNTPVYSVAEGFVSRIKISPGGYGQAIYVDHPDGHRSVYGHLETLRQDLLDTVRARQYATEEFRQDLRFDSTAFPLQGGDRLGGVGNRGHSFGSHLHFEMRDIAEDAPLNPLAFGFPVEDKRAPQIRKLRVYELDAAGLEVNTQTFSPERGYRIPDTVFVSTLRVGLALKTYDRQDGMPNWNGIYSGELFADTTSIFRFAFDRIPFEETEYLNALTDYADWTANTSWYHRFWALTRDAMFWDQGAKSARGYDGTLHLRPRQAMNVKMLVRDHAGNVSELALTLMYQTENNSAARPHQYFLPAGEASLIDNENLRLYLPEKALYRDCYFQYARLPDASANRLSATHQLHHPLVPLHGRAEIAIRPDHSLPDDLRGKVILGSCDDEGHWSGRSASYRDDGRYHTSISSFGDYALYLDTLPPSVEIDYFPTDLRRANGFSLFLKDNVSAGRLDFRGSINGQWILLEYDAKNDRLSYDFREREIGPGEHRFLLEVKDARGNTARWERGFRR